MKNKDNDNNKDNNKVLSLDGVTIFKNPRFLPQLFAIPTYSALIVSQSEQETIFCLHSNKGYYTIYKYQASKNPNVLPKMYSLGVSNSLNGIKDYYHIDKFIQNPE